MGDFLERISKLSPKRLALLAAELQAKVDAFESQSAEPIAIIGMACRFPGGVNTPAEFWNLLRSGTDAIREVPRERWDIEAYYDPDPEAPGKMSTRWGGFLEEVAQFDPQFFGIAPREAVSLDPQQRLLLEVSWEALEHAGLAADQLSGTPTGVFIGVCGADYSQLLLERGPAAIDAYLASGTAHSIAAGRLSYTLGLQGPSLAIDTACSSSLVALHYACQSLRLRECQAALAGGVNLILKPDVTIALSKAHMMAADGRCKTFASAADGFVRGEGCGIVVLKRLADAQAAGDPVLAVIRGTAVNQDGRSNGLTAPNGLAQEAVIRAALANAGVEPAALGYVETHGTGTSLGDPIEVRALGAVLGTGRSAANALRLGSVKTNIGHLESAAGVAGLLKVILMLQHGEVPPHLHLEARNPYIEWDRWPFTIPTEVVPWPAAGRRVAGLSSFGFGGTNAHVIVEEAPAVEPAPLAQDRPVQVVTLSAKSAAAVEALSRRYAEHLAAHPELPLADVAYTANLGRAHLAHRRAVVAATTAELQQRLHTGAGVLRGVAQEGQAPEIAFLFTGQGAQAVGMSRALYAAQPAFRRLLDDCAEILRPLLPEPLLTVLWGEGEAGALLPDTAYTQPALFAVEYALAELWRSWGLEPSVVLGHSVGEYVAACVAGVFSLEDGLKLIAARGRLMSALPRLGMMAAVFAEAERVTAALAPVAGRVAIAAINGPAHTVISGEIAAVQAVLEALAAQGVKARSLNVSHAFHSPLMDPLREDFERVAGQITYQAPRRPLISNLTGELMSAAPEAGYWWRHLRQPVQFAAGMQTAQARGVRAYVEIGPAPVLLGLGRACLPDGEELWLPSLRPGREDWAQLLESVGTLYVHGAALNWAGFERDYAAGRRRVVLPTYPFQRGRFWIEGASRPIPAAAPTFGDWLYEVDWQPAAEAGPSFADIQPAALAAQLEAALAPLSARFNLAAYNAFLPRLNALSAAFVRQAFHQLGWAGQPGERTTAAALMPRLGIIARHHRLVERMLVMLGEDGWLRRADSEWEVERPLPADDPSTLGRELLAQFPAHSAELRLTIRCAEQLAGVLRGVVDPLQLLFPGGSLADTEELYQNSPSARFYNTLIQTALEAALAHVPPGRRLRVLEVGGGTGGTTAYLLPRLSAQTADYVFTDVSPLFTRQAEQKFSPYPFVRYQLLDIGQAPVTQGFQPQSFDLIVAANVLHATPDLRQTLRHVRDLLAPGGLLVLLEGTAPQRFGDLTVGLTEGWWAFADSELRPDYALLSQARWLTLLRELEFADPVAVPRLAAAGDVLSQQAIVLAHRPVEEAPAAAGSSPERWLIFADRAGRGRALAERLAARGARTTLVYPSGSAPADACQIDPVDPEAFRQLIEQTLAAGPLPRLGVVHLWALDQELTDEASPEQLASAQIGGTASVLHLVQALSVQAAAVPVNLWLVTQGAQPVGEAERLSVGQSPLWGMSGVIALEHPELNCRRLDLDPQSVSAHAAQLVEELTGGHGPEDQIARRGGRRLVRRLKRSALSERAAAGPAAFGSSGTYLITGGLNGLGLRVAEWMVTRGARRLVLLGRRGARLEAQPVLEGLRQAGAQVTAVAADVAEAAQVARVLADIDQSGFPLAGVFHCAGVLDDGLLTQLSWERFRQVLAPKVAGAWNLHQQTRRYPLDFFVMFSSGGSLLGLPGQSNHAAANAFLDALAHHRRALGLPALSLNWGAWSEVGSVVTHAVGGRVAQQGLGLIPPQRGLEVLGYALACGRPQLAVIPVQWPAFLRPFAATAVPPMLARFAAEAPLIRSSDRPAEPPLGQRLEAAAPAQRREVLREHIRQAAGRVLRLNPADLDPDQPLQQLGLDSLMAVELRNQLSQSTAQTLPATLLFDQPSINALTEYLGRALLPAPVTTAAEGRKRGAPAAPASQHEGLSEDALASLLAEKLKRLG